MLTDVSIIPAILATTEDEYREKIEKVSTCPGLVRPERGRRAEGWVQIDIMDGKFVPNKRVGLDVIRKYPTILQKEAHLMVEDPSKWVEDLVNLGFERIAVHAEVDRKEAMDAVDLINKLKKKSILALNPETPVEQYKYFEAVVYGVLVMSVHPGFSGQEFILASVDKVKKVKDYALPNTFVGVDGGIDENSAKLLSNAGADYLVIGEHIINGNIAENLEKIRQSLRD
ncbi:MAG: Ribulose-phosphate 3-epimerase [Candidatus Daviesbacteria bacterium GW2011_GWA1_42_6]|uniref:Ribulose-phosphate 3-epimerase n=1 Tax=Candidatus Daviesbacteria bacterium GW2011_GWA1_42_6 TaxID=1618420 RepID=A0A0G1AWX2_9BACT|nr:MAG: Ribulose-phosphate 3-epimerase [Candidatus Daviesbacteria bacterium GW2011_GWA1_42_6]